MPDSEHDASCFAHVADDFVGDVVGDADAHDDDDEADNFSSEKRGVFVADSALHNVSGFHRQH